MDRQMAAEGLESAGRSLLRIYAIKAIADPHALGRIVGLFAQRGLSLDQLCCDRTEDVLAINVQATLVDDHLSNIILEKIRVQPSVIRADLVTQDVP